MHDPDFQPYYNFGFRNALDPEFAAERPTPYPYVHQPQQFLAFLEEHGVAYLVLTPDSPFPALNELCAHDDLPGGFTRIGQVENQYVYAKTN